MSESPKKFYLTTPIYYVNARPHIGHAYTTIVADVLARRHRLLGDDVFFLTGTDEHGQKIERSAAAAGIPPQQFTDRVAAQFQTLWDRMGLTYNKFIRTTDPAHARGVQHLFTELYDRGFIYLSTYTGAYCVSDEAFVDAPVGTRCPDCGRLLEEVTEENFFFKLSAFQRPLIDLIETGILAVEPESRRNEVLSFLRGNLLADATQRPEVHGEAEGGAPVVTSQSIHDHYQLDRDEGLVKDSAQGRPYRVGALKDLSISRSSFTWGIPVPAEVQRAAGTTQNHVIYVWLDALANYITAVGYGDPSESARAEFAKWWPADLHLVGKEIIRFHCVYWPAFLLALNPDYHPGKGVILSEAKDPEAPQTSAPQLPFEQHKAWAERMLPKAITAHGWLLFDNSKMSKSKGNIVRTETILEAFGDEIYGRQFPLSSPHERDLFASDVLRYFLLREIPFGQDGSFSFEALITRYNADLANGYGNLVSRVFSQLAKGFDSVIPVTSDWVRLCRDELIVFEQRPGYVRSSLIADFGAAWHFALLVGEFHSNLERRNFSQALADVWATVAHVDRQLTTYAPWKRSSEERELVGDILYIAAESIRIITALLYPILPYATARVWSQLGLGDIEQAAANGELKNVEWGGLKPGTKLGPLAPIFPRADKGLAQIMTDLENQSSSPLNAPKPVAEQNSSALDSSKLKAHSGPARPEAPLKQAFTPAPAAPVVDDPNHPAAPPASSALDSLAEPSGVLPVAGSLATTTATGPTPSHTEAQPSGAFASAASQAPITAVADDASPQITIDDFAKVELRVAEIKVCERIPKADKLLRLEVDLGHETRQILSGIAEFYTPEELLGRRIIVITNLAPRKMRGLDSHGMLLAASGPDGGKPILATVPEGVPVGSRLK